MPNVDELIGWIRSSGVTINDGDDESDNVKNTGKDYVRADALQALRFLQRKLEVEELVNAGLLIA